MRALGLFYLVAGALHFVRARTYEAMIPEWDDLAARRPGGRPRGGSGAAGKPGGRPPRGRTGAAGKPGGRPPRGRTGAAGKPGGLPTKRALVYASGAAEIAGGAGVLHPATRRAAGWWLIATLVAVFPANVNMAVNAERFRVIPEPLLWLRLPLQAVLIAWAYRAAVRPPRGR